jgi:serine phosphatase RsbU (regulator of sigma subunit)
VAQVKDGHRTVLVMLPFVVMTIVGGVDFLAGPDYGFLPLLSLGPAFASLWCGAMRTGVVGLLALALCLCLAVYDGLLGTRQNALTIASIIGVIAASAMAAASRERRERELASVRSIAEVTQRVLLRPVPSIAGHVRVAVSYTSAIAEARVGGDLYEVTTTSDGVRVIVGDVQGKGLAAVETAAIVLGAFREAAPEGRDLTHVGALLGKAMDRRLDNEDFVTAILAEISQDGTITFLNYGHPSPLIVNSAGEVSFAEPPESALPLGLGDLGAEGPKPYTLPFKPGDQILLYTDGLIEARDRSGRFYPLADRVDLLASPDADAALEAIRNDVARYVNGPLQDDSAMLLLRCLDATGEQCPYQVR